MLNLYSLKFITLFNSRVVPIWVNGANLQVHSIFVSLETGPRNVNHGLYMHLPTYFTLRRYSIRIIELVEIRSWVTKMNKCYCSESQSGLGLGWMPEMNIFPSVSCPSL